MKSIAQLRAEIGANYADLLDAPYPRFSASEMARRDAVLADMMAAHRIDALMVAEAMRAGTATGWITGWPVTAEAVTLIVPGAERRMFIQHFNHLPLARTLARNTEVLWVTALAEGARPGLNERELSALVQAPYLPYGATNLIHYVQSASMNSPDAAVPRQYPSDRRLARGDVLTTELSVDYWGYTGQVLRTFFIQSEPNALYGKLHAVADAVLDRVLDLVRPGVRVRDLIAASHEIEESGFTIIDDLVHGYGGSYLPPVLGSKSRPAAGDVPDMTLEAGMALVIQPNIVTRDWKAGVQTGNLIVVTEEGARSLQRFPRGFHIIN